MTRSKGWRRLAFVIAYYRASTRMWRRAPHLEAETSDGRRSPQKRGPPFTPSATTRAPVEGRAGRHEGTRPCSAEPAQGISQRGEGGQRHQWRLAQRGGYPQGAGEHQPQLGIRPSRPTAAHGLIALARQAGGTPVPWRKSPASHLWPKVIRHTRPRKSSRSNRAPVGLSSPLGSLCQPLTLQPQTGGTLCNPSPATTKFER